MRATPQEQKGGIGKNEVSGKFERIEWGVAPNPDHDLGTDLFLSPRDARLFDLRTVIGAQVKAGPTYFDEPVLDKDTGETCGWWFRKAKLAHFEYWVDHSLPHLIVLYDIDTETAYWERLTRQTVTFLDSGAKVFVPKSQKVDTANAEALIRVATDGAVGRRWEGSAWTGLGNASPLEALRYALLVPRLIAPHPNLGAVEMTAPQALACVVLGRLGELGRRYLPDLTSTPHLDDLPDDAAWAWRLVAGLDEFVRNGSTDDLRTAAATAGAPHERAAATVALAAALIENDQALEAKTVSDELLERDALEPVDHAWVCVQRSRAMRELGETEFARESILGLLNLAPSAPDDLTAAAIGGAAANMVFALSDWGTHDLGTTIAATDTAASWWRQQLKSWGLTAHVQKSFKTWARDRSLTFGGGDSAWSNLRATTLIDGLTGDHDRWRSSIEELSICLLAGSEDETLDDIVTALKSLRLVGAHKSLKLACDRIAANGPAVAVEKAAVGIHPDRSTTTSALADLTLLKAAAGSMPLDRAQNLAQWCIKVASDPTAYHERVDAGFFVAEKVLEVLCALVPALEDDNHQYLVDWILTAPPQVDQLLARQAGRIISSLPSGVWTEDRARAAVARADDDSEELGYPLLAAAATCLPEARHRLISEATEGSHQALRGIGPVNEIDPVVAKALIEKSAIGVGDLVTEAKAGIRSQSTTDPAFTLAILNIWHSEHADWPALLGLFAECNYGDVMYKALEAIGTMADRIPSDVLDAVLPLAERIAALEGGRVDLYSFHDARPAARQVVAAIKGRGTPAQGVDPVALAALAAGSADERRSAVRLSRRPDDATTLGVLVALAGDREASVRSLVATVIVERASHGDAACLRLLPGMARDAGRRVPTALAAAARTYPSVEVVDALIELAEHPLAEVRLLFERARSLVEAASAPRVEGQ